MRKDSSFDLRDPADANIALLIDADNASPDHLDEVLLVLGELGTINIRRAYGNWSKPSLRGWGGLTGLHSIVPMQQFDVVKGKSATDMRMTIDAMDLLYRGNVDGFGIMSSDSDFLPLAQRIREDGLQVYGFGTSKTPQSFQQACSRFFDVAALALDGEAEPPLEQPGTGEGQRPVDAELLQVLGAAYKASKRDEEGYAPLAELGQRAKAVSSFAARNYGFTRLSDLIKAVPNFEVKTGEDGGLLVKRLR
ncbi:MAG TPA: NYN domain-containing protein [Sphingomicrobium sp.]|nr:NYN domain-containing protein [Sphingomicrobium sp.]